MTTASRPPSVVVVHQPSLGLANDARVLAAALQKAVPAASRFWLSIPWDATRDDTVAIQLPETIRNAMPFDAAFFLEHLFCNPPFASPHFAQRRVYVPNVEWILPQDEAAMAAQPAHALLYKNEFAREICESLPHFARTPLRVVTGWSSTDIGPPAPRERRDFASFLHIRGVSRHKQTDIALETWRANPDFPPLRVLTQERIAVPAALASAGNVEVITGTFPAAELSEAQRLHGIHLCPSAAEGFGHTLNEARAAGAVLVTTDAPPMRDLATADATGFLVPVRPGDVTALRRSRRFPIRAEALADVVRQVTRTPPARLQEMGRAARARYDQDGLAFDAAIAAMFGSGGAMPLVP
jgi:Glycosyl transferases group 1